MRNHALLALARYAKTFGKGSPFDALGCVLVDGHMAEATDLYTRVRIELPEPVIDGAPAMLEAGWLVDVVKLSGKVPIKLTSVDPTEIPCVHEPAKLQADADGAILKIVAKTPAAEFPRPLRPFDMPARADLEPGDFAKGGPVAAVLRAVSTDTARAAQSAMLFDRDRAVGTDGHMLCVRKFARALPFPDVLVPRAAVEILLAMCAKFAPLELRVEVTGTDARFTGTCAGGLRWSVTTKLADAKFPSYQQALVEPDTFTTVDVGELRGIVRGLGDWRVAIFPDGGVVAFEGLNGSGDAAMFFPADQPPTEPPLVVLGKGTLGAVLDMLPKEGTIEIGTSAAEKAADKDRLTPALVDGFVLMPMKYPELPTAVAAAVKAAYAKPAQPTDWKQWDGFRVSDGPTFPREVNVDGKETLPDRWLPFHLGAPAEDDCKLTGRLDPPTFTKPLWGQEETMPDPKKAAQAAAAAQQPKQDKPTKAPKAKAKAAAAAAQSPQTEAIRQTGAPTFAVGATVRRGQEVGTVKELIEPSPGWHRARVQWPGSEQFVDIDQLTVEPVASSAQPVPPPPASGPRVVQGSTRRVFTVGQMGLPSLDKLAELALWLGVSAVLDTRTQPPKKGPWTTAGVEGATLTGAGCPVVRSNVATPIADQIAALPAGSVLLLGMDWAPGDNAAFMALAEGTDFEVLHVCVLDKAELTKPLAAHEEPSARWDEVQCIDHGQLVDFIAGKITDYGAYNVSAEFVDPLPPRRPVLALATGTA